MTTQLFSWQSLIDSGWFLFLSLMLGYFWRTRQNRLKTRSWLKTKAQIIRCEWTIQGDSLWPKIEYIYQVGMQEFMGENLFLDTSHNNPNTAQARQLAYRVANAYKNHEGIEVYYNPDKPEQAALDITIPRKLNIIIVLIVFLLALHVVIVSLRLFVTAHSVSRNGRIWHSLDEKLSENGSHSDLAVLFQKVFRPSCTQIRPFTKILVCGVSNYGYSSIRHLQAGFSILDCKLKMAKPRTPCPDGATEN